MNANDWGAFDPWGNDAWPPLGRPAWDYYRWNGGWGYLRFTDLGVYYIHGRWHNSDTGMFLSPNGEGEYFYSTRQDPVNYAWMSDTRIGGSANLLPVFIETRAGATQRLLPLPFRATMTP